MLNYKDILKSAGEKYACIKGIKDVDAAPFIKSDQVIALAMALTDAINKELEKIKEGK